MTILERNRRYPKRLINVIKRVRTQILFDMEVKLSPILFNIYIVNILREWIHEQVGFKIRRNRNLSTVSFVDDRVILDKKNI